MTPNNMIYGDTARYRLYINAYVRAIRYWLKITRMNEKRLPYKSPFDATAFRRTGGEEKK